MYKVNIENSCSCFLKSGIPVTQDFETKEAAQKEAESLLRIMKTNFCQKHNFTLSETLGDYTIYIVPRK
ncbi:MAG: hypothetical protein IE916_00925 [Epsilonproteobacteria bacterium]|nr:hypothetical protein [Campylobacterota bacterium]